MPPLPPGPNQPPGPPYSNLPERVVPSGPPLVTIGDITVEPQRIITPAGVMPTKGAVWSATDMSRTEERMPAYAIVLAIIFFLFCLLGLLFLLIKERRTEGFVQVTVHSGGRMHSTMIPVQSPMAAADILARVNYARSVSS